MIGTNSIDVEQLSQNYGIGRGVSLNMRDHIQRGDVLDGR